MYFSSPQIRFYMIGEMRDRLLRYSACECYHSRSTNQETGAGMLLTFFNISNLIPPPLTEDKAENRMGRLYLYHL